jgi:hypothetical protein
LKIPAIKLKIMKKILEYDTESGEKLLFEIDSFDKFEDSRMRNVSFRDKANSSAKNIKETFEKSINCIELVGESILQKIKKASPDKAEIEFGIKLSADANVIISSVSSEANFKIKMVWENLK